ncbi:MAG TPA: ATP-binding protein [Nitrospira sp.]|nr:ATP-binding protein [Nitrospira sp.]
MRSTTKGLRLFNAIVVSMLLAGIVLVALAVATVKILDRQVIESAAANNRHAEFIRAATFVSREIHRPEDLRNTIKMKQILEDIQHLRPGIRALEALEFAPGAVQSVAKTGSNHSDEALSKIELEQLRANTILSRFDDSGADRAWVFTVPIASNDTVIGALRGRFSVSKYDQLIQAQEEVAKQVAVGAVIVTSLTMLLLVRIQLHRPIARLLGTMEQVRSGNLSLEAPLSGPLEIRRLALNFNQMMAQLHLAIREKEKLVAEIQAWNERLENRVQQAVMDLEKEKDKVGAAQLAAQRNSNLAALGELSAMMAHELGNPLNAVHGRLQLLKALPISGDIARHLDVIKTQLSRMSDVIQHILKSTRIEGEVSAVMINEVVTDVLTVIQAPEVKVVTHLTPNLPAVVANTTSLHSVVLNLVINAVQAMDNAGVLTLTTRLTDGTDMSGHLLVQSVSHEGPMVRLMVQDSGIGIPASVLNKIGEPFFTTRHDRGGTGLGLAICRRVISSAGGRLAVKSSAEQGTTFTIDLPVALGGDECHRRPSASSL